MMTKLQPQQKRFVSRFIIVLIGFRLLSKFQLRIRKGILGFLFRFHFRFFSFYLFFLSASPTGSERPNVWVDQ